MKKIFYWSPHISKVDTVKNVINSDFSLKKFSCIESPKIGWKLNKIKNIVFCTIFNILFIINTYL